MNRSGRSAKKGKTMKELIERFLEYVKIDTRSDENSGTTPSAGKQKVLSGKLADELKEMGVRDVRYDEEHCYVYASIPGEGAAVGFIAHVDTSPEVSGTDVKPQIVTDIRGRKIITSDGTTLLGADDKAGVAEIMDMVQYFMHNNDIRHHTLKIAFTPDEEIGEGTEYFDIEGFGADYAYTVDGGGLGELEYECFNAAEAVVDIIGKNTHPGSAKGIMINALDIACEFARMLPEAEKPQYTSGYEGFFHLSSMQGRVENARLKYIIRDHDSTKFEEKKALMLRTADFLNEIYGSTAVKVTVRDQYRNMGEVMKEHMEVVRKAESAMKELGIEPKIQPIRGGTDGAALSFRGLPTPNLCTGGYNYHSRDEYAAVDEMEKCALLLRKIAEL